MGSCGPSLGTPEGRGGRISSKHQRAHSRRSRPGAQTVRIGLWCRRPELDLWIRTVPWRRLWPPTPVSLPGEPHGQRSLEGCSPRGHKESDATEHHWVFSQGHGTDLISLNPNIVSENPVIP